MKPLAVFYHCRLSCADPVIDFDHAAAVMTEQMEALTDSGLADTASHICIGVNGGEADFTAACIMACRNARVVQHPEGERGEIPTLNLLRQWLPGHEDAYVLYHHIKGAMFKDYQQRHDWRRRMELHVVKNWRRCVDLLDKGYQAVGCHWLTPKQYPGLVGIPYFAGTFWWGRADYLATLPPLPAPTWENRYHAESWIGSGRTPPKIMDFHPGWPA